MSALWPVCISISVSVMYASRIIDDVDEGGSIIITHVGTLGCVCAYVLAIIEGGQLQLMQCSC